MARLRDFTTDTRALQDGTWVRVSQAYGDLEILSRGFTDEFIDDQNAKIARAMDRFGVTDRAQVPNATMREINAELLRDHLVVDVRNLLDDDDQPVSVADFHAMLGDTRYSKLAAACWEAARRVSARSVAEMERAVGNLRTPSGSNSSGGTLEQS